MHHSWTSLFDSTQNRVHVHFAQKSKALFEGMKHTNSLTIFAGTSTFAITPLSFNPPTFINFSLVVMSVTWEKIPGSPRFSVLQATEAGQGLGMKLSVYLVLLTLLVDKTVLTSQVTSLLPNENVLLSYYRQWSWCLLSMWSACWCQIWTLWPCSHV